MPRPVLVTGGAGFIGSHLVNQLLTLGQQVRILELPGVPLAHLPLQRLEVVAGDIRDAAFVARTMRDCAEVYHLAAIPHLWIQPQAAFRQVNYYGTVHVVDAALAAGVRRIVHTSTESILTRHDQQEPIAEDQRVALADAIGPYCRSKLLAERYALRLARRGAPIVIVNPTLPVGPGDQRRTPPTQLLLDFCRGRRREYLDAQINLIDVRDVAAGLAQAMHLGLPGRRYLLGNENMTLRALFALLAELTGLPPPRWRVPYVAALGYACLSEWLATVVTGIPPAATITGVRLTRRCMHFDTRRSLQELGITPRPIRQALLDAAAWFEEMGWTTRRAQSQRCQVSPQST